MLTISVDEVKEVKRSNKSFLCILVLIAVACLSRIPYITGVVENDPMRTFTSIYHVSSHGIAPGVNMVDPSGAFITQPLGHLAAIDWFSGKIPWWNPFEGVGAPLAGEMQGGALFLPFVLFQYFNFGAILISITLQALAGIFTFCLLRQLKLSPLAAVTGGALFVLNGTFARFQDSTIQPIAFLPMLLWGVENSWSATKQKKPYGWIVTALALAWSLYAGFPETAYIDGLLAAVIVIVRFCQSSNIEKPIFVKKISLSVVTGLALASPILVAFFDYLAFSYNGAHDSKAFVEAAMPKQFLPQIFIPYLYGPIAAFTVGSTPWGLYPLWSGAAGYLSTAAVLFCSSSWFSKKEHVIQFTLAGWIVFCILKIFHIGPLSDAFNFLPFTKQLAFFRYCWPSCELALSILVSFKLDDFITTHALSIESKRKALTLNILFFCLIIALPLITAKSLLRELFHNQAASLWITGSLVASEVFAIAIAIAIATNSDSKKKGFLLAAILVLEAYGLFMIPTFSAIREARPQMGAAKFLQKHINLYRFYSLGPIEPNLGSYLGIAQINDNDVPVPKKWRNYVTSHLYKSNDSSFIGKPMTGDCNPAQQLIANLDSYKWVGVKYVVAPPTTNIVNKSLKLVFKDTAAQVYEVDEPSPYFEIPINNAVLTKTSRTVLDADCTTDSILIRRELFFPGWFATVNGTRVELKEYKGLFQSIMLPKGHSHVQFDYLPPYISYANILFLLAAVFVSIAGLRSWVPKRGEY